MKILGLPRGATPADCTAQRSIGPHIRRYHVVARHQGLRLWGAVRWKLAYDIDPALRVLPWAWRLWASQIARLTHPQFLSLALLWRSERAFERSLYARPGLT
ncbi:hypothetical protein IG631_20187 [Alternaria alternata]|nr:hypothetical protein IG631_20187 [Alternaria alternata]